MTSLSDLRKEYSLEILSQKNVDPDPVRQFDAWFNEARKSITGEPNAMILSTADLLGKPSSRVVLLKGFSSAGFVFFTNYSSRKGTELTENPFAALLFFWGELERQVRIEGKAEKISPEESAEYFGSRPRQSQIGALASSQSEFVEKRSVLEEKFSLLEKEFEGKEIPRPENWGGFMLKPDYFEFWQGRQSRLHDRICYRWLDDSWEIGRLSP